MEMKSALATKTKRALERRELRLYYAVAFLLFLPLAMADRGIDRVRGRSGEHRGSLIDETSAKVSGMLGFVFMS